MADMKELQTNRPTKGIPLISSPLHGRGLKKLRRDYKNLGSCYNP